MIDELRKVNKNTLIFMALGFAFFIGGFSNPLSLIPAGIAFVLAFINIYKWSKIEKSDEPLEEEDTFRAPRTAVYATTPIKADESDEIFEKED
ncbi:MAG TPA: hypothetical protein VIK34_07905 [Clostridiaceae bacterium]